MTDGVTDGVTDGRSDGRTGVSTFNEREDRAGRGAARDERDGGPAGDTARERMGVHAGA